MLLKIKDFFTSGWAFDASEHELKNRYQMVNIGILLSTAGLVFGIIGNYIRDLHDFIPLEITLLCINFVMFFALRKYRNFFEFFAMGMTLQYTFLFLFLIYLSHPYDLKHLWIFTYPIILLYFQKTIHSIYWLLFILVMLLIAPLQSFIDVKYSLYQIFYISFVLVIVSIIIYFYKKKIDEAKTTILQQQEMLKNFNSELEKQVKDKTMELIKLNESLEVVVEQKLEELRRKDQILEVQSKQAVMGEMISMIAHQWRQPLTTIGLSSDNMLFDIALDNLDAPSLEENLKTIKNQVMYLSRTIDDFRTFFMPNKEKEHICVHDCLENTLGLIGKNLEQSGIDVRLSLEDTTPLFLHKNELVQVFLSILQNAKDVLMQKKRTAPTITIKSFEDAQSVTVVIADNGGGIEKEHLYKIFEPYFTTKQNLNGTGLGLYMSKTIIEERCCGSIKAQNSSDGAEFIMIFKKVCE